MRPRGTVQFPVFTRLSHRCRAGTAQAADLKVCMWATRQRKRLTARIIKDAKSHCRFEVRVIRGEFPRFVLFVYLGVQFFSFPGPFRAGLL